MTRAVSFSGRASAGVLCVILDITLKWKMGMLEKVDEKRLIRSLAYVTEEEAPKECGWMF